MVCPAVKRDGVYRPRRPQASPLWRLLDRHYEQFERVYDDRFRARYGLWRPVIARTVKQFLACGDLEQGFARVRCIGELTRPFAGEIRRLSKVPGLQRRSIENILAEIGTDMHRSPSHAHLASWAGLCSGNRESAGKRRTGKTTPGNRWLRSTLNQAAWAASHRKESYFQAQYRRLAGRRGKKRATVAVGHSLLVVIDHMLKHGREYADLGADYLDRLDPMRVKRYHVKRLERLGYQVTLTQQKEAA